MKRKSALILLTVVFGCVTEDQFPNNDASSLFLDRMLPNGVEDAIERTVTTPQTSRDKDLFEYAVKAKHILSQPEARMKLKQRMESSNSDEIVMDELTSDVSNFGQLTYNNGRHLQSEFDDAQQVVIYHVNLNSSDLLTDPIVAIGLEIQVDTTQDGDDLIAGWVLSTSEKAIFLDEDFVKETEHPVYIITTNGSITLPVNPTDLPPTQQSNNTNTRQLNANLEARILEYIITERYDNSNRSEYSYQLVYNLGNGAYNEGGSRTEIREIHKDDMGKKFTHSLEIWELGHYISNFNGFWIITFEYDWYAGRKTVALGGNVFTSDFVRMSGANDWYQIGYYDWVAQLTTIYSKGWVKIRLIEP